MAVQGNTQNGGGMTYLPGAPGAILATIAVPQPGDKRKVVRLPQGKLDQSIEQLGLIP